MSATPVTVAALVAAVLARLEAKISGYTIEPFPDKPETYQLKSQKGAFLAAYRGADYGDVDAQGGVVQLRRQLVDVVIQARQLNGAGDSYAMIDMALTTLLGHRVPGFTQLAAVRERFLFRDENRWCYAITFAAITMAVELPDEGDVDVLLEQLTLVSPFATSEIPNV